MIDDFSRYSLPDAILINKLRRALYELACKKVIGDHESRTKSQQK